MLVRTRALDFARNELGVREDPAGSNSGPRVNEYLASAGLGPGYPWCMAFVHWCYARAGKQLHHPNLASVGFFEEWAREQGVLVSHPQVGDVVCYDWDGNGWPDHVGLVEKVEADHIVAIEGNTSFENDANGGTVMRRTRRLSGCAFARIPGAVTVPVWAVKARALSPMWAWTLWRDHGSPDRWRPAHVPKRVPAWWWARYILHRRKR
jgi:hypothetical protein